MQYFANPLLFLPKRILRLLFAYFVVTHQPVVFCKVAKHIDGGNDAGLSHFMPIVTEPRSLHILKLCVRWEWGRRFSNCPPGPKEKLNCANTNSLPPRYKNRDRNSSPHKLQGHTHAGSGHSLGLVSHQVREIVLCPPKINIVSFFFSLSFLCGENIAPLRKSTVFSFFYLFFFFMLGGGHSERGGMCPHTGGFHISLH